MHDHGRDLSGALLGGRYRLRRRIGEGGMGAVYEAWQEDLRRPVAVKVIAGQKPDEASVARFQREARAAAALGHPHIVQIYDFQIPTAPNEPPFLVMELLPGPSLADALNAHGPMQPERIGRIARQVLDALAAAHGAGVVHRDIKPANIAIVNSATLGEIAKVLDFGVAKLAESTTGPLSSAGLVGTIAYMSPEQAAGLEVDGRSDVYSVAVCMYVACTLQKPFDGDSAEQILRALFAGAYKPLSALRPDLDPGFAAIIERGMATDRNQRYASAPAMAADLDMWLASRVSQLPHTPRPMSGHPHAGGAPTYPPPAPSSGNVLYGPSPVPHSQPYYQPVPHGPLHAGPPQTSQQVPRYAAQQHHPSHGPMASQLGHSATTQQSPPQHVVAAQPTFAQDPTRRVGPLALVFGLLFGLLFVGGGAAALVIMRPDLLTGNAPDASLPDATPPITAPSTPPEPSSSAIPTTAPTAVPTSPPTATATLAPSSNRRLVDAAVPVPSNAPTATPTPLTPPPTPTPPPGGPDGNIGAKCTKRSECTTPQADCDRGMCACGSGFSFCPGLGCVLTRFNPEHCGDCNVKCPPPNTCTGGRCKKCGIFQHEALCSGICIDTRLDQKNCGGCGITCPPGSMCANGVCKKL